VWVRKFKRSSRNNGSLLSGMSVSFVILVGLFCHICRRLLSLENLKGVGAEIQQKQQK